MSFSRTLILAGWLATVGFLRAEATSAVLISKSILLEGNVAYMCVDRVADGLGNELGFQSRLMRIVTETNRSKATRPMDDVARINRILPATNDLAGLILDLRFADGDSSSMVKTVADSFVTPKLPLAILVNGETRGAAATLAATLRERRVGLIFGSATTGVKPDIEVTVSVADERAYFADAYAILAKTNALPATGQTVTNLVTVTNQTPRRRVSEVDLVEARRKGAADPEDALDNTPAPPALPEKPVVRDPVLARALDLLQGLALVRRTHGG